MTSALPPAVDDLLVVVDKALASARRKGIDHLEGWQEMAAVRRRVDEEARVNPAEVGGAPTGVLHPRTSRRAAMGVRSGCQEHVVLWLVSRAGAGGLTAFEASGDRLWAQVRPGISPNQVGARVVALRAKGLVRPLERDGQVVQRRAAKGMAEAFTVTLLGRTEIDRLGPPAL